MTDTKLISELEKWMHEYGFDFQMWGQGRVNVYITKAGIEVKEFGQCENIRIGMTNCVEWCRSQNPSGKVTPTPIGSRCIGCGCKVAVGKDLCGECACEDDSDI